MARRGFETGSDNERIDEIQTQLDDVIDSQIISVGANEDISVNATRGARNAASGDEGGVRSNEPIIHQITDVDSTGTPTGVFDKINLVSSMIIVDFSTPAVDMELRFIQGTAKDGAKIKITPKVGRTLIIKSGGDILTSSDITVTDTEYYELVKHSEAETGVSGGAYKILLSDGSGGASTPPFSDADPLIKNDADPTKLSKFSNALITAGITRTYILPDTDTILGGLAVLSQEWLGSNLFSGGITVRDVNFFIQDSVDITKQAKFQAGSITSGAVRTFTFPDSNTVLGGLSVPSQTWTGSNTFLGSTTLISSSFFTVESALTTFGNSASDIFNFVGRIGSSLIPTLDASFDIGSPSLEWSKIVVATIDAFTETTVSSPIFSIDSSIINLGDVEGDAINIKGTVQTDILLDGGQRIRSQDSTEIGIFVTNFTGSIGTAGSNQSPVVGSLTSTVANLDAAFGDVIGAHGVYNTGAAFINIAFKVAAGEWLVLACPDAGGNVISDHIT